MKAWRSKKYLEFIRKQPCLCCGEIAGNAHHEGLNSMFKPTGDKYPDHYAIPLCAIHHAERHAWANKPEMFYSRYSAIVHLRILRFLNEYLTQEGVS